MKRKKRFVSAVLAVLLSFVLATGAGAGDWHGYAVYRDGATPQGIPLGLGNQWHAALMGEATKNAILGRLLWMEKTIWGFIGPKKLRMRRHLIHL